MKLVIYTNLQEKFNMPMLKEMAKEPLIVDNVISFKVVTDEQIKKQQDRKEHYRISNQEKRDKARNRKVFCHICPDSTNSCKILLNDDFTCKRCNKFVPESERIDVQTLYDQYKQSHRTLRKKFQKFKKEIDSTPVDAKSISDELLKIESNEDRVVCYSSNGRMKCCHNKTDNCDCKCHIDVITGTLTENKND